MNINLQYDNEKNTEIVDTFVKQYVKWHKREKYPAMTSIDVDNVLDLQRRRLEKYNIRKEMEFASDKTHKRALKNFTIIDKGDYQSDVSCKDYKITETYFVNNIQKIKTTRWQNFYVTITRLINHNAKGVAECPNCGAVSEVTDLLNGCKNCGTRFIVEDLYPIITNFYTINTIAGGEDFVKKTQYAAMAGNSLFLTTFMFLLNGLLGTLSPSHEDFLFYWVECFMVGIVGGSVCGMLLWITGMILYQLFGSVRGVFLFSSNVKAKSNLPKLMRQFDRNFSYEYFLGKIYNLMKLMIFSDDYTNLAVYDGKPMQNQFKDIIDVNYDSTVKLNSFNIKGAYCYVDITVYTKVLKFNCGNIVKENEDFRMVVCKNIYATTNAGFSVKKVSCKSCGGSFDATREHNCPYCGTPYHLGNDDWVVIDFRKE